MLCAAGAPGNCHLMQSQASIQTRAPSFAFPDEAQKAAMFAASMGPALQRNAMQAVLAAQVAGQPMELLSANSQGRPAMPTVPESNGVTNHAACASSLLQPGMQSWTAPNLTASYAPGHPAAPAPTSPMLNSSMAANAWNPAQGPRSPGCNYQPSYTGFPASSAMNVPASPAAPARTFQHSYTGHPAASPESPCRPRMMASPWSPAPACARHEAGSLSSMPSFVAQAAQPASITTRPCAAKAPAARPMAPPPPPAYLNPGPIAQQPSTGQPLQQGPGAIGRPAHQYATAPLSHQVAMPPGHQNAGQLHRQSAGQLCHQGAGQPYHQGAAQRCQPAAWSHCPPATGQPHYSGAKQLGHQPIAAPPPAPLCGSLQTLPQAAPQAMRPGQAQASPMAYARPWEVVSPMAPPMAPPAAMGKCGVSKQQAGMPVRPAPWGQLRF